MSSESEYNALCKELAEQYNVSEYVVSCILGEARDFWKKQYDSEPTKNSGFTTYDAPGCCSLCGSFVCGGNCFK